jgi:hypothetical protein
MKKVCILSISNIKHMSLVTKYIDILKKHDIKYDIIYKDKFGHKEELMDSNLFVFKKVQSPDTNRLIKLKNNLAFKSYAKKIIRKNEYDFIIAWGDTTAFIFSNYLSKYFPNKYSLNIRDYWFQRNHLIFNIFNRGIQNSAFTTISSDAFKSFLPKFDYIFLHSHNKHILKNLPRRESKAINKPIRLTFVGNIRYLPINKQLLQVFKNDSRFELHFYGTNANKLEYFSLNHAISNAFFHDKFNIAETNHFFQKTDVVNNIFGNDNGTATYLLSIRLYHAAHFKVPLLVSAGTHMAKIINQYNLGFVVDSIDQDTKEKIYKWYLDFDYDSFSKNCDIFLADVTQNNEIFEKTFSNIITSNK